MRAICEACEAPQPLDWKAGDLCTACGHAVRQELRCFWCAEWTPAGRFCRGCGAEQVEPRMFGAARMLKDAGTDRFTVPRMLRELDREQIENFSRIYERHAAVVERHVSDLRFLERHLRFCRASIALEDELVRELPWPADRLRTLQAKPLPAGDDLAMVAAITESTPIAITRALAPVVRLRLGDVTALRATVAATAAGGDVAREAVLVLLDWRTDVLIEQAGLDPCRADRRWLATIADCPDPLLVAACTAWAGGEADPDRLREALDAPDQSVRITAALALGDRDRLVAMLAADPRQRWVAARHLASLGETAVLAPVLVTGDDDLRLAILRRLRGKEPVPELREALLTVLASLPPPEGRPRRAEAIADRAVRLIARGLPSALAGRVAQYANQGLYGCQGLLGDEAGLDADAVAAVIDVLIARGRLQGDMNGMTAAAKRGALADDYVPSRWAEAPEDLRRDLLRLAEAQYGHGGGDVLLRLFWRTVYTAADPGLREAAWWSQRRAARDRGLPHSENGELVLTTAAIERCFGPVREFLPRFEEMLAHPAFRGGSLRDHLTHVLRYAPAEVSALLASDPDAGCRVIDLVAGLVELGPPLDSSGIEFLRTLAADARWQPRIVPHWQRWRSAKAVPMHVWDRLSERCGADR